MNPFSGNVISHGLNARADHPVLGDLLKCTVTDERRDRVLTEIRSMLRERSVDCVKAADAVECKVKFLAVFRLCAEGNRERECSLYVFNRTKSVLRSLRNTQHLLFDVEARVKASRRRLFLAHEKTSQCAARHLIRAFR